MVLVIPAGSPSVLLSIKDVSLFQLTFLIDYGLLLNTLLKIVHEMIILTGLTDEESTLVLDEGSI